MNLLIGLDTFDAELHLLPMRLDRMDIANTTNPIPAQRTAALIPYLLKS